MILIGGSTGQLGSAVVAQLAKQGAKGNFAVLARNAEKAKEYFNQGIEVRLADYDYPDSLSAALDGIERFLFISTMSQNRGPQQKAVVDTAHAAGVKHIVYTGHAIKNIDTSAVRELMKSHFETEDHIRASGMEWTFLRNTMYAEAIPEIVGRDAVSSGISVPGGTGRVPYALRSEMGEATANLLLNDGHTGKTYNITGNDNLSYDDLVQILSRLTGRQLEYRNISEQQFSDALQAAGMPDFPIWLTLNTLRDIKSGQYDLRSRDLETLLGRPPASGEKMLNEVFSIAH
ncbi:SDR family oxidoreductase [Acetobacter aceti]|uniref:NAD(P)-dependent oxidoreductase n=1 Tax=Acetobacter aceti TaxID=435 RepID=A0A6S6PLE3_ACEAC|nr:SDR family oxidoreductase [Acetobacter aceti]BCI65572.1 NAD(P)-dependent oxidoreductase [Acetobacter aceti]